MSKCKNCNCVCHCGIKEHSDMYGVCSCTACACRDESVVNETIVNDTDECESCQ